MTDGQSSIFKCKSCGYHFVDKEYNPLCHKCRKLEANAEAYLNRPNPQARIHRVTCKFCGRVFNTSANYDACPSCRKNIPVHDEVCELCEHSFRTRSNSKICPTCRQLRYKKSHATPKRKCHDCGRPTTDYRCSSCWIKLRKRLGLGVNVDCNEDYE